MDCPFTFNTSHDVDGTKRDAYFESTKFLIDHTLYIDQNL